MNNKTYWLFRPHFILAIVFTSLLGYHVAYGRDLTHYLVPESVYQFTLDIFFEADRDIEVATFLPLENGRQEILDEHIIAKSQDMRDKSNVDGRYIEWHGGQDSKTISYKGLISLRKSQFEIADGIEIPTHYAEELQAYLQPTEAIPVEHEEVQQLWQEIKPTNSGKSKDVLQAIYNYTHKQIKSLPFKGFTDSLTALRLQAASCNGKSRLFISLARLNNLPSRLVGGIILDGRKKKTSHQWVEVYIEGHWVPFDATNGHFSALPQYYMELYRGDHQLFRHTSDINFNYAFNSSKEQIAPALFRSVENNISFIPNAASLLQHLGLSIKATYIFLLLPLCTLLISFLKNIVGIKTFGTFMPMLVAAACVYTGFLTGFIGFSCVLILAFAGHVVLGHFHILKVPRLASIITLISIFSLAGISLLDTPLGIETGILALFPAVIISFTADRIHQMSDEHNWNDILINCLGTLLTIFLCYLAFNSVLLQGLFILYPESLLLVLAILLHIGSWTGMRVSEVIRFGKLITNQQNGIIGLNERNREFIGKQNDNALLTLAADKLKTKAALEKAAIPSPQTLAVCQSHTEIGKLLSDIVNLKEFVIKPNCGSRGNGILLLAGHSKQGYTTRSGKLLSKTAIQAHISEILSGSYSQSGQEDIAYVEPMIKQHAVLHAIAPNGLCDIRLIVQQGQLISTMLRVPTVKSGGKANLHQGAIGIAVNLFSGVTERALINNREIALHPDNNALLNGIQLPHWNEIRRIAEQCYDAIPLGYMGVDICIDNQHGPLVLEVNGRPGLEIQNVQNAGLHPMIAMAATV